MQLKTLLQGLFFFRRTQIQENYLQFQSVIFQSFRATQNHKQNSIHPHCIGAAEEMEIWKSQEIKLPVSAWLTLGLSEKHVFIDWVKLPFEPPIYT